MQYLYRHIKERTETYLNDSLVKDITSADHTYSVHV